MIDWFNVYVGEMSGFYITKTSPRSYHVNANKQICQHQAIFRPWIFCQLRKSFVRLIYGYPSTIHQILKRSWQHHFLANRLSQRSGAPNEQIKQKIFWGVFVGPM